MACLKVALNDRRVNFSAAVVCGRFDLEKNLGVGRSLRCTKRAQSIRESIVKEIVGRIAHHEVEVGTRFPLIEREHIGDSVSVDPAWRSVVWRFAVIDDYDLLGRRPQKLGHAGMPEVFYETTQPETASRASGPEDRCCASSLSHQPAA